MATFPICSHESIPLRAHSWLPGTEGNSEGSSESTPTSTPLVTTPSDDSLSKPPPIRPDFNLSYTDLGIRESQSVIGFNNRRFPNSNHDFALSWGYRLCTQDVEQKQGIDIDDRVDENNPFNIKVEPYMGINWDRKIPNIFSRRMAKNLLRNRDDGSALLRELREAEDGDDNVLEIVIDRKGKKREINPDPIIDAKFEPQITRNTQPEQESKNGAETALKYEPVFHSDSDGDSSNFISVPLSISSPLKRNKRFINLNSLETQNDIVRNEPSKSNRAIIVKNHFNNFKDFPLVKIRNVQTCLGAGYHFNRSRSTSRSPNYALPSVVAKHFADRFISDEELDKAHKDKKVEKARIAEARKEKIRSTFPDLASKALNMYFQNYGEVKGMERFVKWLEFETEYYQVEYTVDMALKEKERRSKWYRRLFYQMLEIMEYHTRRRKM